MDNMYKIYTDSMKTWHVKHNDLETWLQIYMYIC